MCRTIAQNLDMKLVVKYLLRGKGGFKSPPVANTAFNGVADLGEDEITAMAREMGVKRWGLVALRLACKNCCLAHDAIAKSGRPLEPESFSLLAVAYFGGGGTRVERAVAHGALLTLIRVSGWRRFHPPAKWLDGCSGRGLGDLTENLKTGDPRRRMWAAAILGKRGAQAKGAVAELIRGARSEDRGVRWASLRALGEIGEASRVLPELAGSLKHSDWGTRTGAIAALGMSADENAIPLLVKALDDSEGSVRGAAVAALADFATATEIVAPLVNCLQDEDRAVRRVALEALGRIGPQGAAAQGRIACALSDDAGTALQAAAALCRIDPAGQGDRMIQVLLDALQDEDETVRRHAASALGTVGGSAEIIGLSLIRALTDSKWRVRVGAWESLLATNMAVRGRDIIAALVAALSADEWYIRSYAAEALGQLGPGAASAQVALARALEDEARPVRLAAALALKSVATMEIATPVPLSEMDHSRSTELQEDIERALRWSRNHGRDHLSLADQLDLGVLERAEELLSELVDPLVAALDAEEPLVRTHAADGLGALGPAALGGGARLLRALDDPVDLVKLAAASALANIGIGRGESLLALGALVTGDRLEIRDKAASIIARIRGE